MKNEHFLIGTPLSVTEKVFMTKNDHFLMGRWQKSVCDEKWALSLETPQSVTKKCLGQKMTMTRQWQCYMMSLFWNVDTIHGSTPDTTYLCKLLKSIWIGWLLPLDGCTIAGWRCGCWLCQQQVWRCVGKNQNGFYFEKISSTLSLDWQPICFDRCPLPVRRRQQGGADPLFVLDLFACPL